jgi:hypothetical protein
MIRKVYEVDPMVCPKCGGMMKVISFLTDYAVVSRIFFVILSFAWAGGLGDFRRFRRRGRFLPHVPAPQSRR